MRVLLRPRTVTAWTRMGSMPVALLLSVVLDHGHDLDMRS